MFILSERKRVLNVIVIHALGCILPLPFNGRGQGGGSFLIVNKLHVCNLLLELLHLLLLKDALVLDRHNLYELFNVAVPVVEHASGER